MAKEEFRTESDSMGDVSVPASRLWGAQTQRSLNNFNIGISKARGFKARMPRGIVRSFGILKRSCAIANLKLNNLDKSIAHAIIQACDEVIAGKWDEEFPLSVYQTGSGTQSNMNANEVIGNRAIQIMGGVVGSKSPVHPNDHVNRSASSNDTFPSVMHICTAMAVSNELIPALEKLMNAIETKINDPDIGSVIKCGRTHLMDATPLTVGQEMSAWFTQLSNNLKRIKFAREDLFGLAQGGTAVGTGLNTIEGFDKMVAEEVALYTKLPFFSASNKFTMLSSHDELAMMSGSLKVLADSLMKIANDLRLLASGPRCGLGEYSLPANEPGSSIMPGKVNPTQCEAMTMVCARVIGNDTAVSIGAMQGHLQLNVFKPLIVSSTMESIELLTDAIHSFTDKCVSGLKINKGVINGYLSNSLMLVTALNPHIGYDKAAMIAKKAHKEGLTLKEAALKLNLLTSEQFAKFVDPSKMIAPKPQQSRL